MDFTEESFIGAIRAIETSTLGPDQCRVIDGIISSGGASRLVWGMLPNVRAATDDKARAVKEIMARFEALTEHSPTNARVLMVALYPTAAQLHLHDVCNAIDLWVASGNLDELKPQIQRIAKSECDEGNRRHLENMVRNGS